MERSTWSVDLDGEAPVVLLPENAAVVAVMIRNFRSGFRRVLVRNFEPEDQLPTLSPSLSDIQSVADVESLQIELTSPRSDFPLIIGFENASEPTTAFLVSPEDPKYRDLGIQGATLYVEKTVQPVSAPVAADKLPWLQTISPTQRIRIEHNPAATGGFSRNEILGE